MIIYLLIIIIENVVNTISELLLKLSDSCMLSSSGILTLKIITRISL